jgi:hypothetical protein
LGRRGAASNAAAIACPQVQPKIWSLSHSGGLKFIRNKMMMQKTTVYYGKIQTFRVLLLLSCESLEHA